MAGTYRKTATSKSASVDSLKSGLDETDLKAWATASRGFSRELETVPKGWYRTDDLAGAMGCSPSTLQRLIKRLRAEGKVEQRQFMINAGARVYPVIHYKMKRA